jgi:hypothetical protein
MMMVSPVPAPESFVPHVPLPIPGSPSRVALHTQIDEHRFESGRESSPTDPRYAFCCWKIEFFKVKNRHIGIFKIGDNFFFRYLSYFYCCRSFVGFFAIFLLLSLKFIFMKIKKSGKTDLNSSKLRRRYK